MALKLVVTASYTVTLKAFAIQHTEFCYNSEKLELVNIIARLCNK